jgi:hypothetical protein
MQIANRLIPSTVPRLPENNNVPWFLQLVFPVESSHFCGKALLTRVRSAESISEITPINPVFAQTKTPVCPLCPAFLAFGFFTAAKQSQDLSARSRRTA